MLNIMQKNNRYVGLQKNGLGRVKTLPYSKVCEGVMVCI